MSQDTKIVPSDAVLIPKGAARVFKGILYDTYQWHQKLFDGSHTTYEMLRRLDTAIVIGVVDGKLLVTKDDQPHAGLRHGFPAGKVWRDEDALAAAKREMQEETGYTFQNWRLVSVIQRERQIEWFMYVFLAWDGAQTDEPHLEAGEHIAVEFLPFEQARQVVLKSGSRFGATVDLMKSCRSVDDLLALPEFAGKEVGV